MVESPASSCMPACPSSSALSPAFMRRRAKGMFHHGLCPTDDFVFERFGFYHFVDHAHALGFDGALYWRHINHISRAFSVRRCGRDRRHRSRHRRSRRGGPVWPKMALVEAMVRSHMRWRTWPPPMAYPLTMAMTGLGRERICFCTSRHIEAGHSVTANVAAASL